MALATGAAILGSLKLAQKLIDDLYSRGKKDFYLKIGKVRFESLANQMLNDISENVVKVSTLFHLDKIVDLNDFYHAPVVNYLNDKDVVHDIGFLGSGNLLILGTAGQGKSMFMRYMTALEAQKQSRIPIFLEFRKNQNKTIRESIVNKFSDYFEDMSNGLFEEFAKEGAIVLFLDGFDEVEVERAAVFLEELESFSIRYKKMRIIVSSRYEGDIVKSARFSRVEIQDCDFRDQKIIIRKLVKPDDIYNSIIRAIQDSNADVIDLLKTPLLITILVMKYLVNMDVPENQYGFYKDIFYVLAERHDRLKSYERKFSSGLSIKQLQECFEGFCFLSKIRGAISFDFSDMHEMFEKSIEINGLNNVKSGDVISDITQNVCLIVRDGPGYSFIHKSIQEFFFASYIAKIESDVDKVYRKISDSYRDYKVEMEFLEFIDPYKWSKYFIIPVFSDGLSYFGFNSYEDFYDFVIKNFIIVKVPKTSFSVQQMGVESLECYAFYEGTYNNYIGKIDRSLLNDGYKNFFCFFVFSEIYEFFIDCLYGREVGLDAMRSTSWGFNFNIRKDSDVSFFYLKDADGFDFFLKDLYFSIHRKIDEAQDFVSRREGNNKFLECFFQKK